MDENSLGVGLSQFFRSAADHGGGAKREYAISLSRALHVQTIQRPSVKITFTVVSTSTGRPLSK
jgi:hypothetical protein